MSSYESFASKLAAGAAEVSKTTSWWPRHQHAMGEYLSVLFADMDVKSAKERMLSLATEWAVVAPVAARRRAGAAVGIMAEHAALEMEFVEAAKAPNLPALERIPEKLFENVKAHGARYAHALKGFPEARFEELMREHIALFVDSVTRRVDKDRKGMAKCAEAMDANSIALATISAEWF